MSALRVQVGSWLVLAALAGCTTDLDQLVDDGIDDAAAAPGELPDGAVDQFPPPTMEPPFQVPDPITDPPGPFAFTLVHGVVDAPRIFLCWADHGAPQGEPWPASGLAFGESWVTSELPDIDPETDSLQLIVIGADPDLISGLDCEQILDDPRTGLTLGGSVSALTRSNASSLISALGPADAAATDAGVSDAGAFDASMPVDAASVGEAGTAPTASDDAGLPEAGLLEAGSEGPEPPPEIRAAYLPVVPAGTLRSDGSYLLTLAGCLGGFTTQDERAVCGSSYFPDRPTLTPMLVRMSRLITFGNPSLQFMQASLGAGVVTLSSVPGELHTGTQITIASDVLPGVLDPYPPLQSVAPTTYGDPLGLVGLQLTSEVGATWSDSWGPALEQLDIDALEGLTGYTLIFIGPDPWLMSEDTQWWNDPRFVLVRNSPDQ